MGRHTRSGSCAVGGLTVALDDVVTMFTGAYQGRSGHPSFATALNDIQKYGKKRGCWKWYVWPRGRCPDPANASATSGGWALSREGAAKFLGDEYLRECYLSMVQAVATKLEEPDAQPDSICGEPEWLASSCDLFRGLGDEAVTAACDRVVAVLRGNRTVGGAAAAGGAFSRQFSTGVAATDDDDVAKKRKADMMATMKATKKAKKVVVVTRSLPAERVAKAREREQRITSP